MNRSVGLDIGSHSIKLVELGKDRSGITLLAAGTIPTPPKALGSKLSSDLESVAVAIKELYKVTGCKSRTANIALPESQVFTRVIEVPQLSQRELASAIKWEAEQYIPLPLDQVNIDFTILRDGKATNTGKMEVLLVAAPKVLIGKYLTILELSEISVANAETEIIAAARSLVRSTSTVKTAMIVSLGAQTTDLAILHNGIIAFTRSISSGGEALSRAVAQGLDFNLVQAEEFKKTYGLERDKVEGKILTAAKPIMETIVGEMKRALEFYLEKHKEEPIQAIMLSGGTARLPGMVVYIAETMSIETQLANPWVGIRKDPRQTMLDTDAVTYTVSVGLALR